MSCSNCSQVIVNTDSLPPLVPESAPVESPCSETESSVGSPGCVLDNCLTDPKGIPYGGEVTLLAREGDRMARLTGNGFIEVKNGLASLTPSPTLRIRDIWAEYDAYGKISDPLNHPFSIAVDANGVMHALMGLRDHDSLQVWDKAAQAWTSVKVSALKHSVSATIPQSDHIELTGFEEVGMNNSECGKDREMKALRGNGMVYLEKVPVNACDDPCSSEAFAYVAKVLEFPEVVGSETYKLQFSFTGLEWVVES